MIVILDSNESILEFMDDADASITITDTYGGYKSLDFDCELTDVKHDQLLFRQGNKLLIENILFVINTEVELDYVDNLISLEAEELVCEMNNCAPFYIDDPLYSRYVSGKTLTINKNVLNLLFDGFYTVDVTDLTEIDRNLKMVTVQGTITKYNLLKAIEDATGLMFKYTYRLEGNNIVKKVSLLKPENYGVTHNKLLERVVVGENTNKLEYSTDETKNALGIMPIMKSEDSSQVNYSKILKQFNNLDINNENIMPYYANYAFSKDDVVSAAKRLYAKIESYKFIPETVTISHEEIYDMGDYDYTDDSYNGTWPANRVYTLDIGMSQFLDLATNVILNNLDDYPLTGVKIPSSSVHTNLNCIFTVDEIYVLANKIQDHIIKSNEINNSISTSKGLVSFQWLVYIFSEYLSTGKMVVCKTEEYPKLNKILPSHVEDDIDYIVDYDNYEHMPFMYTQNTSESSNIPVETPTNSGLNNVFDVSNYISETLPVLKVKKTAGASQIYIKVYSKGIADSDRISSIINFKEPTLIQDDSELTIDYSKETIEYMKYVETTVEKEVEETVETENPDTITCTGKNTCGCCGYPKMPYKNYTRTYKNYCPACGRSGTLVFGPKNIVDGEITCGNTGPACKNKGTVNGKAVTKSIKGCDADYCVQCGGDKWGSGRCKTRKLTPAEATTTGAVKKTVTETVGEYKQVTASNDDATADSKTSLSETITAQSSFGVYYGDVQIELVGCTFVSLQSDSCKLYELSPFPYIKRAGEQFIYAPVTKASFNYTHMTNNNPKLEPFETSEQSVEEVLIGCWKKLNGSGDNTAWLDRAEDINVDLTEENLDLNAGDFVYIKLPDTLIFKAQITEKKYDPKIKSDSSLKIGNISRESII